MGDVDQAQEVGRRQSEIRDLTGQDGLASVDEVGEVWCNVLQSKYGVKKEDGAPFKGRIRSSHF